MGFYHLDLDALAAYENMPVEKLKEKSYAELETMIEAMQEDKFIKQNNVNARDAEYKRLVLKYFKPVSLLSHWFSEDEIVYACAHTGITERDLCQEINVPVGSKYHHHDSEFLRTDIAYVPQYDSRGRQLLNGKHEKRDIYRIAHQHQDLWHGKAVLYLLYHRYPELKKFKFSAYSLDAHDYEIYPKNGIYTSLTAIMSGDIDWILYRNREYCKEYNNGRYTIKECEKAFRSEEAQDMFKVIRHIGKQEKALGHSIIHTDKNGGMVTAHGLVPRKIFAPTGMSFLVNPNDTSQAAAKHPFKLPLLDPCTVGHLMESFISIPGHRATDIHVCHTEDYLGSHAAHFKASNDVLDIKESALFGLPVQDTFGWFDSRHIDFTIRIDCPRLIDGSK